MLSQINPLHTDKHFVLISLNIILPFTPRFFKMFSTFTITYQYIVLISGLSNACYVTGLSSPLNKIQWKLQTMKFLIMQFFSKFIFVTPPRPLGPNISLSTKPLNLCLSVTWMTRFHTHLTANKGNSLKKTSDGNNITLLLVNKSGVWQR